ncbi:MAG: zinc ribbon domain-containing protein [Chloroflexi bacterium]|nr:zinc ribbon domain-containing protein [Chloroflexota bacterium]
MKCASCGSDNPSEYRFCGGCGAPLQAPQFQTAPVPSSFPSFNFPTRVYFWGIGVPTLFVLPVLAIVAICVMCFSVLLMIPRATTSRTDASQVALATKPRATETPKLQSVAQILPTITPTMTRTPATPEEQLAAIATNGLKDNFRKASIWQSVATIDYGVKIFLDEGHAIRTASQTMTILAPGVFRNISTVKTLEVRMFTEFKDAYGNRKDEVAIKFTMTRGVFGKINWESFDPRNLGAVLSESGSGVYVHPALQKAWVEYQRK